MEAPFLIIPILQIALPWFNKMKNLQISRSSALVINKQALNRAKEF